MVQDLLWWILETKMEPTINKKTSPHGTSNQKGWKCEFADICNEITSVWGLGNPNFVRFRWVTPEAGSEAQ